MQKLLDGRLGERGSRGSREADLGPVHPLGRDVPREQALEERLVLAGRVLDLPRERRTEGDDGRLEERVEGMYPPGPERVEGLRCGLSRGGPHELEEAEPG